MEIFLRIFDSVHDRDLCDGEWGAQIISPFTVGLVNSSYSNLMDMLKETIEEEVQTYREKMNLYNDATYAAFRAVEIKDWLKQHPEAEHLVKALDRVFKEANSVARSEECPTLYTTEKEPLFIIKCDFCGQRFKGEGHNYAYGCASYLDKGELDGGYGSLVADFMEFRTTGAWDLPVNKGQMCDECILRLVEIGKLEFVKAAFPDDTGFDLQKAAAWFAKQKAAGEIDYYNEE